MSKPNGAVRKAATHFETVPLEIVKEIAVKDVPLDETIAVTNDIVEPAKKRLLSPVPTCPPAGKRR